MRKKICLFILKMFGWKPTLVIDIPKKCVFCVAPHTSNWDLIVGELMYFAIGGTHKVFFLIKKEWFRFPLNYVFNKIGGIAVDRKKNNSLVDQIVDEFKSRDEIRLAVTPEATRKANPKWKKGFYYIAIKAQVPILLVHLDYSRKEAGIAKIFVPTGDEEKDIMEIKRYYLAFKGKNPEGYAI